MKSVSQERREATEQQQDQTHKAREPDYERLRKLLRRGTGKKVSPERARRIGAFLLRLTKRLDELQ
jgi:hypothetical protein